MRALVILVLLAGCSREPKPRAAVVIADAAVVAKVAVDAAPPPPPPSATARIELGNLPLTIEARAGATVRSPDGAQAEVAVDGCSFTVRAARAGEPAKPRKGQVGTRHDIRGTTYECGGTAADTAQAACIERACATLAPL